MNRNGFARLLLGAALFFTAVLGVRAEWTTIDMDGEPIEVFRDDFGVPHVTASSFRGIFFGQGYVAAQDRLWQFEMYRRDARGELAELLGESYLDHDRRARSRYHTETERQAIFDAMTDEMQSVYEAFRDGVNAYIATATRNHLLPKKYREIDATPRPWTVTDSVAIIEMMASRFGSGGTEELQFKEVLDQLVALHGEKVGQAIFDDLIPINDKDAPTTMPKTYRVRYSKAARPGRARWQYAQLPKMSPSFARDYVDGLRQDQRIAERIGSFTKLGSNAWVIAPKRSATGNAILFGGPMMGFRTPQIAYEVHLNGPAHPDGTGTMNVIGMAFAGIPTVLIGHTPITAWTTTSGGGNVSDLYIEQLNPDNPHQYRFKGEWRDMERIPQEIVVRDKDGSTRQETFDLYRTVHGPVVSIEAEKHVAVSVKHSYWQGKGDGLMRAFLEYNRATSPDEFMRASSFIPTTHNFFYADQNGNIAYAWVGRYPIRPKGTDWRMPLPGTGEYEWEGFIPFKDLPKAVNPEQGYFGNWNNKPSDDWESIYGRIFWGHRIYRRLESNPSFTVQDAMALARETGTNDFVADYFSPYLRMALAHPRMKELPEANEIAQIDAKYDRILGVGSAGERIYDTFVRTLIEQVFGDEMPFLFKKNLPNEEFLLLGSLLLRVFEPDTSYLKPSQDYLNGKSVEDAVADALAATIQKLGPDASKWGAEPRYIDFGEAGKIPWARRGTYMQTVELTKPVATGWNILPPGQSGDPESPHYTDQLDLFRAWRFKPTVIRTEALGTGSR